MTSSKSRRLPLHLTLACYLPVLALTAIANTLIHPLVLIPLLLANVVAMAVVCHAIGFAPETSFGRTMLRRGSAWLVLFTGYTAVVWLLIALPMVSLTTTPSLGGVVMLALALAIALAVLWRIWPAFGLLFLWDDAFPEPGQGSWMLAAVSRSLAFARHLAGEEHFFTQFLPSALATLVLAAGALLLSGLYDLLPDSLRTAVLWLYGIVIMPACCLVIANRMLRALLLARPDTTAQPIDDGGPDTTPERPSGLAETPQPSPHELAPGVATQQLWQAVIGGDTATALAMLDAGADPNARPEPGATDQRSLIVRAALLPDTHLLRALVTHGADVNLSHHGMTALLAVARDACGWGSEATTVLLANGADPTTSDTSDSEGNTALHHAVRAHEPAVAAALVDADAPINALNRHGRSPLALACRAGNWPLVGWLLEHHAQPDPPGGEPGLVAAASIDEDDPRGVELLLQHKARTDTGDRLGRTPLMTAALGGHAQIIQRLLAAHAHVNAADQHGTTALMEAARSGNAATVSALIGATADVTLHDRHGRDALILACLSPRGSVALVAALVAAGANPHAAPTSGHSAIDCATQAGRWDLVAAMDPDAELPATIAATQEPDPEAGNPEDLLAALRFGHWAIVAGFTRRVMEWPEATRAGLYVQLLEPEQTRARAWLSQHGLAPDARLDDGQRLFDHLIETLPASATAVHERLHAGASPSGYALVAQAIDRLAAMPEDGVALVLALLTGGGDPFGALPDGRTPLHLATAPGWLPVLAWLLTSGCAPNARDHAGRTALHSAVAAHNADAVRMLVRAGADPELADSNGETPLGLALILNLPQLERWLRWGPWLPPHRTLRDDDLIAAAAAGDATATGKLLELGLHADATDSHGASALVHACGRGHHDVAALLLDAGANAGTLTRSGVTPLVAAVNLEQVELITLLLARGVAVDQPLPGGTTALMVACAKGHAKAAQMLLDAGAHVDAVDVGGYTPLHAAARYCFASTDSLRAQRLLEALLAAQANIDAADTKGLTPLLMLLGAHARPGTGGNATHLGALLPVLLSAGADVNHASAQGMTALHACAVHALLAPARVLVSHGANRSAPDAFGRRPADVAYQLGYTDVGVELEDRHAGIPRVSQTLQQPAGDGNLDA